MLAVSQLPQRWSHKSLSALGTSYLQAWTAVVLNSDLWSVFFNELGNWHYMPRKISLKKWDELRTEFPLIHPPPFVPVITFSVLQWLLYCLSFPVQEEAHKHLVQWMFIVNAVLLYNWWTIDCYKPPWVLFERKEWGINRINSIKWNEIGTCNFILHKHF